MSESEIDIVTLMETDPMAHIESVQGVSSCLGYQKQVIHSVAQHERTVVAASHDLGKTFLAAKIVLWFASTFAGAKVITTAPTFNQVKRLLWSEIRAGYSKSKYHLGGEMLMTEWKIAEDHFAVGFTSRNEAASNDSQMGSSFQGFHAPAILVVFDEATGIAPGIWKQMEGLMTSHFVRFLGIGNPTTKSCEFYKCFSNPAYQKIYLSCFNSPNFPANGLSTLTDLTAEYLKLKELNQEQQYNILQNYKTIDRNLLSVKWVMQMVLAWGLTHPLVVSKCFGQFPDEDQNSLFSLGDIQKAQYRKYQPQSFERMAIGVDVARFGSDKTVITRIHGSQLVERKVLMKRDTSETAGEIVRMIKAIDGCRDIHVAIDATGIGSGVVDSLKESRNAKIIPGDVEIRECHFGDAPGDEKYKAKYVNLKARIFVELSQDIKSTLALLDEDIYLEELPTIQYKFDSKGRWQIESKEEYKARTGRSSPDDADSLALANYARYDAAGSGKFNKVFTEQKKTTIISHTRDNLW